MKILLYYLLFGLLLTGCEGSDQYDQVGRDPLWYPLNLRGKEAAVQAFSDALLEYVADKEDIPIAIYSASGGSLLIGLNREWTNGVLTSVSPTPENRAVYDFSEVYLYLGPVLVVPESSDATSIDDMANSLVGIVGSADVITDLARVPYLLMKPYAMIPVALEDLAKGEIQGALIESLEAYSYIADLYRGVLKVVTPPLTDLGLRMIVLKGTNEKLLKAFNQGLEKAIDKGVYSQLSDEWGLHLDQGADAKFRK
jgi:ABC-type amino acid transport substrate-binding protein